MVAEMLAGLVPGGVYAALAVCIVLMYQMLGVVNFALGAMGGLGACMSLLCVRWFGLGPVPSTLAAVVCGAIIGVVLGLLVARYFLEASVELRTTVTIAIMVGLIAVGDRILNGATYSFPNLFAGPSIEIFGTGVAIGSLAEVVVALLLAVGVQVFLRTTYLGAQLRAMSERPITAGLLGIRVRTLTVAVWAFTSAVATIAVMVVLPTSTTSFPSLAYLVIFALGAALLGLLRNMVVAAVGGVLIGMLQSIVQPSAIGRYTEAVPFAVIVLVMVWWRRRDVWSEAR
jgi:branched-chain amino acid transport system permease protein